MIATKTELDSMKAELDKFYQHSSWTTLTKAGDKTQILGMQLTRHETPKGQIYYTLSQEDKFDTLLQLATTQIGDIPTRQTRLPKTNISKRKAASITQAEREEVNKIFKTSKYSESVTFMQQCVGSLLYLSQTCNPELSYPAIVLGRRAISPTKEVAEALIHCLGYCYSIKKQATYLGHPQAWGRKHRMIALSDSSLGNAPGAYSSAGYALHTYGTPIISKAYTIKCVSLSSCEAELLAMSKACQAAMRYHHILNDIQPVIEAWGIETSSKTPKLGPSTITDDLFKDRFDGRPIFVAGDNVSALRIAATDHESLRISHIRTQTLFLCEQVYKTKTCGLVHIDTNFIAVDTHTKEGTGATSRRHGRFLRGNPMQDTQ